VGINSQSGKGGIAWVINLGLGLDLPPGLARNFSKVVKERSIQLGREMSSDEVCVVFLEQYQVPRAANTLGNDMMQAVLRTETPIIAAVSNAMDLPSLSASITSHSFADSVINCAAFANVTPEESKPSLWGVGTGASLKQAELHAVMSALQVSTSVNRV
jgi:hypothetical protein